MLRNVCDWGHTHSGGGIPDLESLLVIWEAATGQTPCRLLPAYHPIPAHCQGLCRLSLVRCCLTCQHLCGDHWPQPSLLHCWSCRARAATRPGTFLLKFDLQEKVLPGSLLNSLWAVSLASQGSLQSCRDVQRMGTPLECPVPLPPCPGHSFFIDQVLHSPQLLTGRLIPPGGGSSRTKIHLLATGSQRTFL